MEISLEELNKWRNDLSEFYGVSISLKETKEFLEGLEEQIKATSVDEFILGDK